MGPSPSTHHAPPRNPSDGQISRRQPRTGNLKPAINLRCRPFRRADHGDCREELARTGRRPAQSERHWAKSVIPRREQRLFWYGMMRAIIHRGVLEMDAKIALL
jgi:hypothetical protein